MDVPDLMVFDEDKQIAEGNDLLVKVETSLRKLKIEYQKALKDYARAKSGNPEVFEETEPKYLKLLAKLQKAIKDATKLWDDVIANIEASKAKKREKAEFFIAGIIWAIDTLKVDDATKDQLIKDAKAIIQ